MEKARVFIANVANLNLEKVYEFLPIFRKNKVNSLKNIDDKKLSAGVYLLLEIALRKCGININDFLFKTLENGKPYLENCPLKFSYSHSGEFVIAVISEKDIGIDIQKIKEINPQIAHLIFNKNDEDYYESNINKNEALNKIWVLKEAHAKVNGNIDLKRTNIDYKTSNVYKIKDYYFAVAPNQEIEVEEITL